MRLIEKLASVHNQYPEIDWSVVLEREPQKTVSFVVPTLNSATSLGYVLESIANQRLRHLVCEVIIIDDSSTDTTRQVVRDFSKRSSVNIVYRRYESRHYAAYARNRGVELATGEIICFIDSDIIVPQDYLDYHLSLHELHPDAISLSFRSFIDIECYASLSAGFPIKIYANEFRVYKKIPASWCHTDQRLIFKDKHVRLFEETNGFRRLGNGNAHFWTLPEVCLGCAITYRKEDIVLVGGAPENFKGWGYNDVSLAAKIIALGRRVIPIAKCGVYHLSHPKRSGNNRDQELILNRKKYEKMLLLQEEDTRQSSIPCLEAIR